MKENTQEKSQIKQKILLYLTHKGTTPYEFYKLSGVTRGILTQNNGINEENLAKFLAYASDINPTWLLTGQGEMLKTNRSKESDARILSNKAESINNGKVTEFTPITQEKEHNIILETRPRIPLEAAAGMLSVTTESVTKEQCEQVPVIAAMPNYDFTIMVKGDSMEPDFKSGDEVACRFVRESSFIQWGQPHIIDSYDGIVLKRIHDNGDRIICSSDNPNYGNFQIPKNEINRLALVVGLIRLY